MEPNKIETVPVTNETLVGPIKLASSAWILFKTNWKLLVGIAVIPSLIIFIGQLLVLTSAYNLILGLFSFVLFLLALVISVVSQSASINAIHRLETESGVVLNYRDQYKFGFAIFGSVLFAFILQGLISIGSFVLLIIPGLIVGVYVVVYLFTLIIDNKKGLDAFTESYSLVYGKWFSVFLRILFLALIYIICTIVITGVVFIIQTIFNIEPKSVLESVLSMIASLVISSTLMPFALCYIYKLFKALKEKRNQNVSTGEFRNWLKAFMVLGIIAPILFIVVILFSFAFIFSNLR